MRTSVSKSALKGRVRAPSSKSYTIRGLMCAALARGESQIINPLISDDTQASMRVLAQIGVDTFQEAGQWLVRGGAFQEPNADLHCGESAATLRFMTAICSLIPGKCQLVSGTSLSKRPVRPLVESLRKLGVNSSCQGELPPVVIHGGSLKGGVAELPGNISSQFISALLLISPLAKRAVTIRLTTPLESKPYVLMTLDCLKEFGIKVEFSKDLRQFNTSKQAYKPTMYNVEGDWSSASYLLALGALAGEVEVKNLKPESSQGDKIILDFLREAGASVKVNKDSITVKKTELKAIQADLSDCIDLLPTMAALAAAANGVSQFTGIERARIKESNRVATVREGLERMGIKVSEERNILTITGSTPKGSLVDAKNDHRIAMAFGMLGTVAGETIIEGAECVSKTYPQFWETLKSLGGKVKIDEQ